MAYGKVDVTKAKAKLDSLHQNNNFWTPKTGLNTVRILPPWKDTVDTFYKEAAVHWDVGANHQMFFCPKRMERRPCYLCDTVGRLLDSDDSDEVQQGQRMRARTRIYYNIVDLNDKEAGTQIYASGITVFEQLLKYIADPDWGDITDPAEGYDIILERTGEGINTTYTVRLRKKESPLENMEWLEKMSDLDTLISFATEAEMRSAFTGSSVSSVAEEEDSIGDPIGLDKVCFGKEYFRLTECEECETQDECREASQAGKRPNTSNIGSAKSKLERGLSGRGAR